MNVMNIKKQNGDIDMKKKLAKYLGDYVEQEIDSFIEAFEVNAEGIIDASLLTNWIIYGIEAFESIEDVEVRFHHPPTTSHGAYYED